MMDNSLAAATVRETAEQVATRHFDALNATSRTWSRDFLWYDARMTSRLTEQQMVRPAPSQAVPLNRPSSWILRGAPAKVGGMRGAACHEHPVSSRSCVCRTTYYQSSQL